MRSPRNQSRRNRTGTLQKIVIFSIVVIGIWSMAHLALYAHGVFLSIAIPTVCMLVINHVKESRRVILCTVKPR